MRSQVVTPPQYLPVSLDEFKDHLNRTADDVDEDTKLTMYLEAAVNDAEVVTSNFLMKQTVEVYLDDWAVNLVLYGITPAQSVTSIEYLDENGAWQTYATANYSADLVSKNPRILISGNFPTLKEESLNRLKITLLCGFSDSNDESTQREAVPDRIRQGILLQGARYYLTRESKNVAGMDPAAARLWRSYRAAL